MINTLFAFLGGKARQAAWIASHIHQTPHNAYVETCCGSAAVFFAKRPSKIEILNDKERKWPLVFKAIRNHFEDFAGFCSLMDYSKETFDESYYHLRGNPDNLPEWQLGCWAFFQVTASYSGYADAHSFAWRLKGVNPARAWAEKVAVLEPYYKRLRSATCTNFDCLDLIGRCDKPKVLMYVDPPYCGAEFRYKAAKDFSHEALAEVLHAVKHAYIILSHYDIEPYTSYYKEWRQELRPSTQSCKGSTKHSPEEKKAVTEALWFNYDVDVYPYSENGDHDVGLQLGPSGR